MPHELTADRSAKLGERVFHHLQVTDLRAPLEGEKEIDFTKRVLQPSISNLLLEIEFNGLLPTGDGAASIQSVHFLNLHFRPDMGISLFNRKVLAIEVKLLRGMSRQNSLATAVGQAALYRAAGYEHVGVLLIDVAGKCTDQHIQDSAQLLSEAGLNLVVRRISQKTLAPHPSATK